MRICREARRVYTPYVNDHTNYRNTVRHTKYGSARIRFSRFISINDPEAWECSFHSCVKLLPDHVNNFDHVELNSSGCCRSHLYILYYTSSWSQLVHSLLERKASQPWLNSKEALSKVQARPQKNISTKAQKIRGATRIRTGVCTGLQVKDHNVLSWPTKLWHRRMAENLGILIKSKPYPAMALHATRFLLCNLYCLISQLNT